MLKEYSLDKVQWDLLLRAMNEPDYVNILAQFVLVLVAAGSGYYFQLKFKKVEENKLLKNDALRFNEATVFMASLIESVSSYLGEIVMPSYEREFEFSKYLNEIALRPQMAREDIRRLENGFSFLSFIPFEITNPEDIIEKVPDIGGHIDIMQTFYRMRNQMMQFRIICDERNTLAKEMAGIAIPVNDIRVPAIKFEQIHNRTCKALEAGEQIFDSALHISRLLTDLRPTILQKLKDAEIKGVIVVSVAPNDYAEVLRKKIKIINDTKPELKGRLLRIKDK